MSVVTQPEVRGFGPEGEGTPSPIFHRDCRHVEYFARVINGYTSEQLFCILRKPACRSCERYSPRLK